jgi:hypothetical protein
MFLASGEGPRDMERPADERREMHLLDCEFSHILICWALEICGMLTARQQVLPPDDSEKEKSEKLIDTASSINAVPREPTKIEFIPIGHISLDSKNEEAEKVDLEIPTEGVFWIKTFFVLHSLQGKGVGRAAMDEVEDMAVREPLWAKTLMLDTVERGDQLREEFAKATFGNIPKVRAFISLMWALLTALSPRGCQSGLVQ